MSTKRIREVALERVAAVAPPRTDSYRSDLVMELLKIIQIQQQGLSVQGRRDRILKTIEAFSTKVIADQSEVEY